MEQKKTKRKPREPKAWLYIDGVKKPFVYERKPGEYSKAGRYNLEHPDDIPKGRIIDMRAVMK